MTNIYRPETKVKIDQLVTTGTPSSSSFLAGDGSYQEITIEPFDVVGGRLDLVSATSIKWGFQNSNQIRLVNPDTGRWELVKVATEPTIANTALDLNGTALTPNTIYDVFAEYSSSTAFNLVLSRWASDGGNGANNPNTSYATPAMSANTSGGVTVSSDITMYAGNSVYNGFDQATGVGSVPFHAATVGTSGYVLVDFGGPVIINKYAWFNQWDIPSRLPIAWTLSGSNDNSNWTSLDTRSNQSFTLNTWSSYYTFTNIMGYRYYKMAMINRNAGEYLTFGELKLVTSQGTVAGSSTRTVTYSASTTYSIGDRVSYGSPTHYWVKTSTAAAGTTPVAGSDWVYNGVAADVGSNSDFYGLYKHDGVLVSSSSTTGKSRRWLGIIYTYNNSGTVNFKDDVNYRYISNLYTRTPKPVVSTNSTTSWNYNSTNRELNGGAGQTRGQFVSCISQSTLLTEARYLSLATSGNYWVVGAAINSTTVSSVSMSFYIGSTITISSSCSAAATVALQIGYSYLTEIESSNGTNTAYASTYGGANMSIEG